MSRTPTTRRQTNATARRSGARSVEERIGPSNVAGRPARQRGHTSNPLRIDRIGTDHMRVHIRPAVGRAELRALVERIEQLLDAGYETIHVVAETVTHEPEPTRPSRLAIEGNGSRVTR
jgi:hypothetical protein